MLCYARTPDTSRMGHRHFPASLFGWSCKLNMTNSLKCYVKIDRIRLVSSHESFISCAADTERPDASPSGGDESSMMSAQMTQEELVGPF